MRPWSALAALVLTALVSREATAQETGTRRIPARVTIATGGSVYLDTGSDAGVEPGDRARAFPSAGGPVDLVVQAASRESARCVFVGAASPVEAGAAAEVLVPTSRKGTASAGPTWPQEDSAWQPDMPLLAPIESIGAGERERLWSGRFHTAFDGTWDRTGDGRTYSLARTGLDATLDNVSGQGDSLFLDAEVFRRSADGGGGGTSDDSLSALRVDRLSWRFGDTRERPNRVEVGRFLHAELPMLGLVDGVEFVHRTKSGDRLGASAGLFPAWDAKLRTGDDWQTSVFYRHVAGENEELSIAGALQKTWHEGEPDRDLVLGDLSWRPSPRWWVAATAWFDHYDSGDAPKSPGFELTELHASTTWRPDDASGLGLALSSVRYPVLLRDELPPLTTETLADGHVERVGVNGWHDMSRTLRLSGRVDRWSDQDDSGLGLEARASWRDVLWDHGELGAGVFTQEGKTTERTGLRLSASRWSGLGAWSLWYELSRNDPSNGADVLLQHLLRGSWDWTLGEHWSLSLGATLQGGDEQDATSIGFTLQRRF